ncbi:MAG: hypothetical protein PUE08_07715 [Eubacteriales bacterium]|nr:hypothetical protein [Eubacteriales bacterium]
MLKKTISFLTALVMVLSVLCVNVYASEFKDIVLTKEEMTENAYLAIENALTDAKNNASDSLTYRIYVPSGNYTLVSGLHIYSNTQLILDKDTVLSRGFQSGNMIKVGLRGEQTRGYSGYKNILIDGGVWDSGYMGESCAMRFAHCTNLTLSNFTIKNIKNAHHMEVAATDGFNLTGCTFSGMIRTNSSSAEAVQIDILHEYEHFPDYYYYDDTPCKNVFVTGCTFTDLYSGIGTRSGVIGSYFDNINITNNTFKNITERAITCFNYRNSSISSNYIENAHLGIAFEYFPYSESSSNVSLRFSQANKGSVVEEVSGKANSSISGNYISVAKTGDFKYNVGIFLYGSNVDSSDAKKYCVAKGDYTIEDMDISNNSISCSGSSSRGIMLTGVNDSEIKANSISQYASANSGINALNLCASNRNSVGSNYISGMFNNGISLYDNEDGDSRGNSITSNTVNGVKSYGVRVAGNSTASIKWNNSFLSCGVSPICVSSVSYAQNLPGAEIKGISRSQSGRAIVKWKAVDGAGGYKIYRSFSPDGPYRQIATVKGNSLMYLDKASRPGFTCYYKVSAYVSPSSTAVISSPGGAYGVRL